MHLRESVIPKEEFLRELDLVVNADLVLIVCNREVTEEDTIRLMVTRDITSEPYSATVHYRTVINPWLGYPEVGDRLLIKDGTLSWGPKFKFKAKVFGSEIIVQEGPIRKRKKACTE